MRKIIELDYKIITIFYNEYSKENKIPAIILNTFDEDEQEIWNNTKRLTNKEYILVTISNINWNKEMSPWYMERLFKEEGDYEGKADEYIEMLTGRIIPKINESVKEILDIDINNYIIAGYSLAGLFAIYSLYKTDIFTSAISCSGSLWYPNFIEYIENNELKIIPNKIYFSLGNKESKTKNELMAKVEEKTKYAKQYYSDKNIETMYEVNEGNHFQNVIERISKGICWILN